MRNTLLQQHIFIRDILVIVVNSRLVDERRRKLRLTFGDERLLHDDERQSKE